MSERTLLFDLVHGHVDRIPNRWVDIDHKSLVIITQKNRATVRSRHYTLYGYFGRVIIHLVIILLVPFVRKHLYRTPLSLH